MYHIHSHREEFGTWTNMVSCEEVLFWIWEYYNLEKTNKNIIDDFHVHFHSLTHLLSCFLKQHQNWIFACSFPCCIKVFLAFWLAPMLLYVAFQHPPNLVSGNYKVISFHQKYWPHFNVTFWWYTVIFLVKFWKYTEKALNKIQSIITPQICFYYFFHHRQKINQCTSCNIS